MDVAPRALDGMRSAKALGEAGRDRRTPGVQPVLVGMAGLEPARW